jgi:hypothetical protein
MSKKQILIIDGQGGRLGKQLCSEIRSVLPDAYIHAVGTNSTSTANMLKGGADSGATGENAVVVGCRNADAIVGPVGIVIADALYGEITSKMASAVGSSSAMRVLIPMNKCDTTVVGVGEYGIAELVSMAATAVKKALE